MTATVTLTDTEIWVLLGQAAVLYAAGALLAVFVVLIHAPAVQPWKYGLVVVFWWVFGICLAWMVTARYLRGEWRPGISVPDVEPDTIDRETL